MDTGISEVDRQRLQYEDEMFEVPKGLLITPDEVRYIITTRRLMEERVGTNGSIDLTIKISKSVDPWMMALFKHQEKMAKLKAKQDADVEELEEASVDGEEG